MKTAIRQVLKAIYPPQCLSCGAITETELALCGPCWRDTPFITGLTCDACGTPLPGEVGTVPVLCDDCMTSARPWARGRAALVYSGAARRLVLRFKHGDRTDLAPAMGAWLARAAAPLITPDTLIVPVPLHRTRLLRRRFNQAALIAAALARETGCAHLPDALIRPRRTRLLDGHDREARFAALQGAIAPHPGRGTRLRDRDVLLVDDVMTSGATLAAATAACHAAGARQVCIAALARVVKDA